MSRTTKIVLGIIGGLALICCIGVAAVAYFTPTLIERTLSPTFSEGPEEAAEVGERIVDYAVPAGYVEEGGISFLGMNMVMIVPEEQTGNDMVFMLMSFPEGLLGDEAAMQQQMQDIFAQQSGTGAAGGEFQTVGTEVVVVNDQETVFTVLEATDENGQGVRQVIGPIKTNDGGLGMLMAFGPSDEWDADRFRDFVRSFR